MATVPISKLVLQLGPKTGIFRLYLVSSFQMIQYIVGPKESVAMFLPPCLFCHKGVILIWDIMFPSNRPLCESLQVILIDTAVKHTWKIYMGYVSLLLRTNHCPCQEGRSPVLSTYLQVSDWFT